MTLAKALQHGKQFGLWCAVSFVGAHACVAKDAGCSLECFGANSEHWVEMAGDVVLVGEVQE